MIPEIIEPKALDAYFLNDRLLLNNGGETKPLLINSGTYPFINSSPDKPLSDTQRLANVTSATYLCIQYMEGCMYGLPMCVLEENGELQPFVTMMQKMGGLCDETHTLGDVKFYSDIRSLVYSAEPMHQFPQGNRQREVRNGDQFSHTAEDFDAVHHTVRESGIPIVWVAGSATYPHPFASTLGQLIGEKGQGCLVGGDCLNEGNCTSVALYRAQQYGCNMSLSVTTPFLSQQVLRVYETKYHLIAPNLATRQEWMSKLSKVMVVLRGGAGTVAEVVDGIFWNLAEPAAAKPIFLLNDHGHFDPMLEWLGSLGLTRSLRIYEDADEMLEELGAMFQTSKLYSSKTLYYR